MYEFSKSALGALGWSDISGYPSCTDPPGGVMRCFTTAEADVNCANSCGCRRTSDRCQTSSMVSGSYSGTAYKWCCPRDCPNPNAPAGQGCIPRTRNLICDLNRVDINTITDTRARAIWIVKNKLCSERIDPGNIDGNLDARMSEALIAVQSRNRIPQTGEADAVTLRLLGFPASEAQQLASAIAQEQEIAPALQLPWALIATTSVASIFMLYAVWKFTKRPKK